MTTKKRTTPPPGFDKEFLRQWSHFEQQFKVLLTKYEGEFVGMRNGQVIDHDKDDEALAARMFDKMGAKRFIIGEVSRTPRVYEIPSVELICGKRGRTTKA